MEAAGWTVIATFLAVLVALFKEDIVYYAFWWHHPRLIVKISRGAPDAAKTPIFGICLGHQLLGLGTGCEIFKLKFGHRGANQPVLNKATNRVEITTQNHGFALDAATLPPDVEVTHVNLNDQTVVGL